MPSARPEGASRFLIQAIPVLGYFGMRPLDVVAKRQRRQILDRARCQYLAYCIRKFNSYKPHLLHSFTAGQGRTAIGIVLRLSLCHGRAVFRADNYNRFNQYWCFDLFKVYRELSPVGDPVAAFNCLQKKFVRLKRLRCHCRRLEVLCD